MLFNTQGFILVYLPLTLLLFYVFGMRGHARLALVWLTLASIFFYAWWNVYYVALLAVSIVFNYAIGAAILKYHDVKKLSKSILILGIASDIGLLIYYKYMGFFIDAISPIFPSLHPLGDII